MKWSVPRVFSKAESSSALETNAATLVVEDPSAIDTTKEGSTLEQVWVSK